MPQGVSSFAAGVLQSVARPEMRWTMSSDDKSGNITVYLSERPTKVCPAHMFAAVSHVMTPLHTPHRRLSSHQRAGTLSPCPR
jgi:hypothetical protein